MRNLLVISPHLDDESLSCSVMIRKCLAYGGNVKILTLFDRRYAGIDKMPVSEYEDCKAALDVMRRSMAGKLDWLWLGLPEGEPTHNGYYALLDRIEHEIEQFQPDDIVTMSSKDRNQDHRFLAEIVHICTRPWNLGKVEKVLEAFSFDGVIKEPNFYLPHDQAMMDLKLEAIACYRREGRSGVHPRAPEYIIAQHKVWGAACGSQYAEAYSLKVARELL